MSCFSCKTELFALRCFRLLSLGDFDWRKYTLFTTYQEVYLYLNTSASTWWMIFGAGSVVSGQWVSVVINSWSVSCLCCLFLLVVRSFELNTHSSSGQSSFVALFITFRGSRNNSWENIQALRFRWAPCDPLMMSSSHSVFLQFEDGARANKSGEGTGTSSVKLSCSEGKRFG